MLYNINPVGPEVIDTLDVSVLRNKNRKSPVSITRLVSWSAWMRLALVLDKGHRCFWVELCHFCFLQSEDKSATVA